MEKEHAEKCINILFDKTEHWGAFARAKFGRKENFKKMSIFSFPLVVLRWHRILQQLFWNNKDSAFFELGNYSE